MIKLKVLTRIVGVFMVLVLAFPILSSAKENNGKANLRNKGHNNLNIDSKQNKGENKGTDLKVMTYNLKNGVEKDHPWDKRRPIMKELLEKEKPDVMGTQEGYKFQLDDIKSDMKGYDWIGHSRAKSGDDEHMAVFYKKSKLKLIEHGDFWLSDTPDEKGSKFPGNVFPRMVTWAKFQDKDTEQQFYILNTHFPYQQNDQARKNREKSAEVIVQELKEEFDTKLPVFLTGDFNNNANDYTKPYQILIDEGNLTDTGLVAESKVNGDFGTFNDYKYPKGDSEGRIDWIMAKGPMSIKQYKVDDFTKDGKYPSDHFPVIEKVHLNDQEDYKPDFAYDDLKVSKTNIDANDPLTVTARVKNKGDMGTKRVHLKVDGKIVDSKLVALGNDQSKKVNFTTELYEGGDHQITVDGMTSKPVTVHPKPAKLTYKNFRAEIGDSYRDLTAKVSVKNIGSFKKEKDLSLYIDGSKQKTRTIELGPGESKEASFSHTFGKKDKTGLRRVRIGNTRTQAVMPYILGDITDQVESVKADEDNPPYEKVTNLVDRDIKTKWLSHSKTAKITMKLSQPEAVNKYAFTSANDAPKRDPKDWTLYGSKDGEHWTKLNSQSGAGFYGRHQRNIYRFKNDDKYTYYRFDITKNSGGGDNSNGGDTQLGEIAIATQFDTLKDEVTNKVDSVHADEDNPPYETDDKLIDGDMSTKWLSGKNTADITMKLSQPEAVDKYAFTSANDFPGRDPQNWTLYGSEDGKDWTKLDNQSGIQFAKRHQTKGFQSGNNKKYTYYRFKITKNAGEADTQLAEIALSVDKNGDQTAPEVHVRMNGKTLDSKMSIADSETAQFTWDAIDEDSGIGKVSATFDGKMYKEAAEIDLAGKAGKHELVVTAVDKAGNKKEKTYEIKVTTSIDDMKKLVRRYEQNGSIKQEAAHLLNLQLITIDHFAKKDDADKVAKHLKGFKTLLDHLKDQQMISDDTYNILKSDKDYLMRKWK